MRAVASARANNADDGQKVRKVCRLSRCPDSKQEITERTKNKICRQESMRTLTVPMMASATGGEPPLLRKP